MVRRYDAGSQNITNIDFSKICIREMMTKNLRPRPHMKWLVMDMTSTKVSPVKLLLWLSMVWPDDVPAHKANA